MLSNTVANQITIKEFEHFTLGVCKCGCNEQIDIRSGHYLKRYQHGHNSKGKNNPAWNGGLVWDGRYWRVWNPEHHRASKQGYIYLHVKIYEETNRVCVLKWTDVDHINGIKTDNRPENLQAFMKADHTRKHKPFLGFKHTEETKLKLSQALKGRKGRRKDHVLQ